MNAPFWELVEDAPVAFAVTHGPKHILVEANAALRALARTAAPALGRPIAETVGPGVATALAHLLDRVYRYAVPTPDYLLIPAGEASWSCTVWPVLDSSGNATGLVLSVRDATQLEIDAALHRDVAEHMLISAMQQNEQAETDAQEYVRLYGEALLGKEQAESITQEQTESLRNVSHELRTPLNAISGYVELLSSGVFGPVTDAQRGALERVRESQQYLLVLVNEVLQFDMVHSGALKVTIVDVAIAPAVTDAAGLIEAMLVNKGITYKDLTCDGNLVAAADPYRLKQILVNLLANALKFTDSGGQVSTLCEATSERVIISVIDTGCGIPEDKQDEIFEPFVQVSASTTNHEKGFGLGLSISRQLARSMGGDLAVTSTLGAGSRFSLSLPRVP